MNFIKIGDRVINVNHILRATLSADHVCLMMVASDKEIPSVALSFSGEEAIALREYLTHPDRTYDLLPSEEVRAFQDYQKRGGQYSPERFFDVFKRHAELMAIENRSEAEILEANVLGGNLLY
jgi:hypothetical protein